MQSNTAPSNIMTAKARIKTIKKGGFFDKDLLVAGSSRGGFLGEAFFFTPRNGLPGKLFGAEAFFVCLPLFTARLFDLGVDFSVGLIRDTP